MTHTREINGHRVSFTRKIKGRVMVVVDCCRMIIYTSSVERAVAAARVWCGVKK